MSTPYTSGRLPASLNSCLNGIPNVPWSQKGPPFNTVSPRYLSVVVTPLGSSLFVQNVETLRSAVHPPKTVGRGRAWADLVELHDAVVVGGERHAGTGAARRVEAAIEPGPAVGALA